MQQASLQLLHVVIRQVSLSLCAVCVEPMGASAVGEREREREDVKEGKRRGKGMGGREGRPCLMMPALVRMADELLCRVFMPASRRSCQVVVISHSLKTGSSNCCITSGASHQPMMLRVARPTTLGPVSPQSVADHMLLIVSQWNKPIELIADLDVRERG